MTKGSVCVETSLTSRMFVPLAWADIRVISGMACQAGDLAYPSQWNGIAVPLPAHPRKDNFLIRSHALFFLFDVHM